jgi:hypothetical protein
MSTTFVTNYGVDEVVDSGTRSAVQDGTLREVVENATPSHLDLLETPVEQTTDDLATLLDDRFVERRDAVLRQDPDGAYRCERRPMTIGDLRAHVAGTASIGHYMIGPDDRCRLFAYDIDLVDHVTDDFGDYSPRRELSNLEHREHLVGDLVIVAEGLGRRIRRLYSDLHVAAAFSGNKGVHVYAFTGSESAEVVREVALDVLEDYGFASTKGKRNFWSHAGFPTLEIEANPKQTTVGHGFGNGMRLPLGRNFKGGDSFFLRLGTPPRGEFHRMDPRDALTGRLPWA